MLVSDIQAVRAFRNKSDDQLIELLYKLAEKHPADFKALIVEDEPTVFTVPGSNSKVSFTPVQLKELRAFSRRDKVPCIKRIREIANVGLKEAKEISEAYFGMDTPIWDDND